MPPNELEWGSSCVHLAIIVARLANTHTTAMVQKMVRRTRAVNETKKMVFTILTEQQPFFGGTFNMDILKNCVK